MAVNGKLDVRFNEREGTLRIKGNEKALLMLQLMVTTALEARCALTMGKFDSPFTDNLEVFVTFQDEISDWGKKRRTDGTLS